MVWGPQTHWVLNLGPMARPMTLTLCPKRGPRPNGSGARAAYNYTMPMTHWACNPGLDTFVHNLGPARLATSQVRT